MTSVVERVKDILEKGTPSSSRFNHEYEKTVSMYQDLINKGVTSKRQSQLLSISDRAKISPIQFNHSDQPLR